MVYTRQSNLGVVNWVDAKHEPHGRSTASKGPTSVISSERTRKGNTMFTVVFSPFWAKVLNIEELNR